MNREIKFRAWTPNYGGVMRTPNALIVVDGKVIGADIGLIGASDIVLMQYTGLKDKNGKEIYEGDILGTKNPDYIGGYSNKYEVQFSTEAVEDDWGNSSFGYRQPDARHEILGNIYENPELL